MKRLFILSVLALFMHATSWAYDFEAVNGDGVTIYYNFLDYDCLTCEVTCPDRGEYSGVVVIPETVETLDWEDGNKVTCTVIEIDDYAFSFHPVTQVTIPNSVTKIGESAFEFCSGLTSVTIGSGVTTIGYRAFDTCTGLTSVTIGNGVTSIGDFAFLGCTGLTSVTIGSGVTSIGEMAFASCSRLTEVNFNATSCTSVSDDTFSGCDISTFNIGENVTIIPDYLCYELTGLTGELVIPNNVTSIGSYAFYRCSRLTIATIGNSVTSIGSSAFEFCSGLTSVTIGNSLTSISDYAFCSCTSLTSVTIPNSVTSIGDYAFYLCSGLTSVTIPNGVTSIGSSAFSGCSGLTSVTIPNGVTSIGSSAFGECTGLTSVTIGNGVTTIGYAAFLGCTRLTSIYSLNPEPPTCGNLVFSVDGSTCVLYVPEGSVEAYSTADTWKDFLNIKEIGEDNPPTVQTFEATEITANSAILNASVTAGDEEILERGFEYWTEGSDVQRVTTHSGNLSVTITELEPNTTYTYRAYAITESGTTYGGEVTFTTMEIATSTAQTHKATTITYNSATLSGSVEAGDEEILEQGFEYWTEGSDVQRVTATGEEMSVTLTGLEPNTTYTYRAYVITASGTTYGEEVTFTTLDYADGVSGVNADLEAEARYTTDGKQMPTPRRGVNIIRYSDGTVKKVLVK